MNRNVKDTVIKIFDDLKDQINEENKFRIVDKSCRLKVKEDRDLYKKNENFVIRTDIVKELTISNEIKIFSLKHCENYYVGISWKKDFFVNEIPGFIDTVSHDLEIQDGLRIVLFGEKIIPFNYVEDFSEKLINNIFGELEINEFEITDFDEYYAPFEVWEIDNTIYNLESEEDLYRIFSLALIQSFKKESVSTLKFESMTLDMFEKVLNNENCRTIAFNIYKSLTATHWEHSYLDLFRCIENLYWIYHLDNLKNGVKKNIDSFVDGIDLETYTSEMMDLLSFRSKERDDVSSLFSKIEENKEALNDIYTSFIVNNYNDIIPDKENSLNVKVDEFVEYMKKQYEGKSNNFNDELFSTSIKEFFKTQDIKERDNQIQKKTGDFFYGLRCSIAHLKYSDSKKEYKDNEWNQISKSILCIIDELYDRYSPTLTKLYSI